MRTDRELLELAAKAAGIETAYWNDGQEPYSSGLGFILPSNRLWNPLTDDGDALRLAVKRSILRCHMDLFHAFYEDELAQDRRPSVATRRAFVRAAAEIGALAHPDNKDGGAERQG